MRRSHACAFLATLSLLWAAPALAADPVRVIAVDRDDDDADGRPDAEQPLVPFGRDLAKLERAGDTTGRVVSFARGLRVLVDGRPLDGPAAVPRTAKRVEIQAERPGRGDVVAFGRTVKLGAVELRAFDGAGAPVDLARSHASLQRTPPERLPDDPTARVSDPDTLRFVVIGVADDLPGVVDVMSFSPGAAKLDTVDGVPLAEVKCPTDAPAGVTCGSTPLIRAVIDDVDRNHPTVSARSIKAELGGALMVAIRGGTKLGAIRVGGPRASPVGPIRRFKATLRFHVLRVAAGGAPAVGGDVQGARAVAQAEVRRANALWGACGISFGAPSELLVTVADPPPTHLVALGCEHGMPASGGTIRLRADREEVAVKLAKGATPASAARAVAAAIEKTGLVVRISDNPVVGPGVFGTSDLLVRRRDGSLATLEPPAAGKISDDSTMPACIGRVDLEDGLSHFADVDAVSGTLEERTLIKAFDDGDPTTIDVLVIPSFAGGGRIGESFIFADGGAVRNLVIEDRAAVRADTASSALSHELGHVLLDDPGHPDDFGLDTPTRLMDADAASPSAHGPRRLLVDECARAIRQSGPDTPAPLLVPWPLVPVGKER